MLKTVAVSEDTGGSQVNHLPHYRGIIEGFGFEEVLADHWHSSWGKDETYFVFAHPKGLLLAFDTIEVMGSTRVNGGKVYYNWKPNPNLKRWPTSSGSMVTDEVWGGDHDCRDYLIRNLTDLEKAGAFVCPWVKRPFLWLLHYDDSKTPDYDYKAITDERVRRLPQWVQDFIGPANR